MCCHGCKWWLHVVAAQVLPWRQVGQEVATEQAEPHRLERPGTAVVLEELLGDGYRTIRGRFSLACLVVFCGSVKVCGTPEP